MTIHVAGGVYLERCISPDWEQLYGSGGRAAGLLAAACEVHLHTYVDERRRASLDARLRAFGAVTLHATPVSEIVSFHYVHPLSVPAISPAPIMAGAPLTLEAQVVLRFGMMEGSAVVRGERVTYDPQDAVKPELFRANGSSAAELAVVANANEIRRLSGRSDLEAAAREVLARDGAQVVVVKAGAAGALVVTPAMTKAVPAYQTAMVFSLGSGDVFAAAFAFFWGRERLGAELAADLASRATANYCESRALSWKSSADLIAQARKPLHHAQRRVYLAGPFFSLGQRWLIEEARSALLGMGLDVFSPLHDVGPGAGEVVAPLDLAGVDDCDVVLALVDGLDSGTLFEVGYARARGKRVVALAERVSAEDLKMIVGSGCAVVGDFATAVYAAAWS